MDDGHVIAPMNVEGMPWYVKGAQRGSERPGDGGEKPELTAAEKRALYGGVLKAVFLVCGVFAAGFLLFLLFCLFVWLK